jgi:hypothetical protein
MKLRIVTYEGRSKKPVIEHVFHGSLRDILKIVEAHRESDEFFASATHVIEAQWGVVGPGTTSHSSGKWKSIDLRSEWVWS